MESEAPATAAVNFPAVMQIVAAIVADPCTFGVQSHRSSQSTDASEGPASIDNTIGKIRNLQGKIQEVEVQAAIRQVQVKILEIKIRQVELMVLVRQAQQVVELKGKEASLLVKKRDLEKRIVDLDKKIRSIDGRMEADPAVVTKLLSDLQVLLAQTEDALTSIHSGSEDTETETVR